jgi:hypothetical protein
MNIASSACSAPSLILSASYGCAVRYLMYSSSAAYTAPSLMLIRVCLLQDRFEREFQSRSRRGRNADSDSESGEGSENEENLLDQLGELCMWICCMWFVYVSILTIAAVLYPTYVFYSNTFVHQYTVCSCVSIILCCADCVVVDSQTLRV